MGRALGLGRFVPRRPRGTFELRRGFRLYERGPEGGMNEWKMSSPPGLSCAKAHSGDPGTPGGNVGLPLVR